MAGSIFRSHPSNTLKKKPDGTVEEKTATPDMYTHIMWAIKKQIPAGFQGEVEFKVQVK